MLWKNSRTDSPLILFGKKSKLYRQSRADFYESKNLLTSTSSFKQVLINNHIEAISSPKEIKFYGLTFGETIKQCKKRLGKPNFVDNRGIVFKNHSTLFYRIQIKGVKCVLQIHFFKDKFFFGQIEIREGNQPLKKELSKLLCQKYGVEDQEWNGIIKDQSLNKILIKEEAIPSICYVTGDEMILEQIKNGLVSKTERKNIQFNQKLAWLIDVV